MLMPEWMVYFNILAAVFWAIQIIFSFLWHNPQKSINIQLDHIPKMSVVVPVFNESNHKVQKVIGSILNQRQVDVEVIVIDDGSFRPLHVDFHAKVKCLRTEENNGKRRAQINAIKHTNTEWIVTVDSDTMLMPDALYELYKVALIEKLDAVTGAIYLDNENCNLLTRMTACLYWYGFFQERASQSYFRSVTCCSGALAMYRRDTILANQEEYLGQTWWGKLLDTGDDRFLTCLFAMSGKSIGVALRSKAYTISPSTFISFIQQQLRWSRSNTPVIFYITRRILRCPGWFLIFTYRMTFRYIYFVILYSAIVFEMLINHNYSIVPIILTVIMIIGLIKGMVAWLYTHELKFLWLLPLGVFSFFILTPIMVYGAITPANTGWLTRRN